MVWTSVFLISIAQGLFLISVVIGRRLQNITASWLILTILCLMVIANLGYLVARTDLKSYLPQLFFIPFGMMFLFGPLFYFYTKAIINQSFQWKANHWLHFVPYFIYLLHLSPFLIVEKTYVLEFVDMFLAGRLVIRPVEKIIFALQDIHLSVYLALTFTWLRSAKQTYGNANYTISIASRIKWVKSFFYCFVFFALTVWVVYIAVLVKGNYTPVTNYVYTLVDSVIIYFIAYKMVLEPSIVIPGFSQKYQAYVKFENTEVARYLDKLKSLLDTDKIYTDPGFKLPVLARELGLPPHQVSKLINEKLKMSFNDLINQCRVNEFIRRLNDSKYQSYNIYGIATDVGFSSKSSFNAAFKKITGKTPSQYKITA